MDSGHQKHPENTCGHTVCYRALLAGIWKFLTCWCSWNFLVRRKEHWRADRRWWSRSWLYNLGALFRSTSYVPGTEGGTGYLRWGPAQRSWQSVGAQTGVEPDTWNVVLTYRTIRASQRQGADDALCPPRAGPWRMNGAPDTGRSCAKKHVVCSGDQMVQVVGPHWISDFPLVNFYLIGLPWESSKVMFITLVLYLFQFISK